MPAAAVLLAPAAVLAQSTGVLTGTVTDSSTRRPLADVVVEVRSPALQGEQVVVTDSSGSYRIPSLPPGAYTISVANEGYRPYTGGVSLSANQTVRANVRLTPTALLAEETVVVAQAPTVDVGSTQVGTTLSQDFTSRVALAPPGGRGGAARSFESVAVVAPGAKGDAYGTSIAGASSPENRYVVDGLAVNNPAYGIGGTPLSVDFVKEVGVITGGYMPEYGRSTGGVINVVTKSGSNELHGGAWVNVSPGVLEGDRTPVRVVGQTVSIDRKLALIHDFGADVGGPILKDRLWFYGGVGFNSTRWRVERNLNRRVCLDPQGRSRECQPEDQFAKDEAGNPLIERIPGTVPEVLPAVEHGFQYIGKLTFAINQDNNVEISAFGAPTFSGGYGVWGIDPQDGGIATGAGHYGAATARYVSESNDVNVRWTSAFDNKTTLVETSLGWHHQRSATLPSDGSELGGDRGLAGLPSVGWSRTSPHAHSIDDFVPVPPGTCAPAETTGEPMSLQVVRGPQCPVRGFATGGPGYIDDALLDRVHGKVVATHLFQGLGHHVVKAGADFEQMSYVHRKAYSGRVNLLESSDGVTFNDNRQYGFLTGPDRAVVQTVQRAASHSTLVGAFAQDSWSVMDRVTVNLGARWDGQFLFGDDGELGLTLPLQVAPRVGVIYDFTQQGRSKIFGSFARYYEAVPLNMVDRQFPGEVQVSSLHSAEACDPRDPAQARGVCQSDASRVHRGKLEETPFDPNQYWYVISSSKVPVDPDIQPQSTDEIVIGGEYEVFPSGRIGVQYVRRYMVNVIEDMSRDEGTTYFLGNPGRGIASDFPAARRDYDGVTLFFTKNFGSLWLAQASYTLSFLRGNIAGLYRPETGQLDPNINSDFDLEALLVNRDGPLPGDTTHEIKVYAARDFPFDELVRGPDDMMVSLGVGYTGRSGGPTNFLGAHPRYGLDEVFILPRGSGPRLPFVHRIDGRLTYGIKLAKDAQLAVYVDVFNLFNFQEVAGIDERYTRVPVHPIEDGEPGADGEPDPAQIRRADATTDTFVRDRDRNPNYGQPAGYQQPRTFRFGMRVTF